LSEAASQVKIMVLVSGSGSNLQVLHNAEVAGQLGEGKISLVVSDRPDVYALQRAKAYGLAACTEQPDKKLPAGEARRELSGRILRIAKDNGIDIIVLAGFLSILTGELLEQYSGRIINLHPSLLPKFGGEGMYGERVHRAVLQAGETESGCTVHFVDEGTDTGTILLQRKVPVQKDDTPASLAKRVQEQEHIAIVQAVKTLTCNLATKNTTNS